MSICPKCGATEYSGEYVRGIIEKNNKLKEQLKLAKDILVWLGDPHREITLNERYSKVKEVLLKLLG